MKNSFKINKSKVENFDYFIRELIFTFIFRDLLYVVLPLIVIAFTYYIFGSFNLIEFFSSSDVAFAVVVFNAMALSSFIELKVKHQNPNSWSLFEGSKMYILLIVISTLLLSFIVLNEIGVLGKVIEKKHICLYNIGLFSISSFALFMKNSVLLCKKYGIGEKINATKLFRKIKDATDSADYDLDNILYLIEKSDEKDLKTFPEDQRQIDIYKKHKLENIKSFIQQNREKLDLVEKKISKYPPHQRHLS
ncbi:MAG: hypothetical protein PHQ65_12945 [Bacteroidales bacterium]|nr:hypothetical protein [Bacteroidales bacterium]MDD3666166.1 hypothetical protein [Bacteroidales bacterium]